MAYTNSPLVTYTKLSPNHSGQRTHGIDRITPHCVVGQLTVAGICGCFTSPAREASCNYGIGTAGDIGMCVEEKNRSWCSSSSSNDQRAVTIECASDMSEPYAMNSAVYESLILLCTDICRRNGKKKLLWLGEKAATLNYSPKADEMILTVHRWFANKSCPGDWLYSRMGDLAAKVTTALGGDKPSPSGGVYRVRKNWTDSKSQVGAFTVLENAKACADKHPGYSVFDFRGNAVYQANASAEFQPYKVRVAIDDLIIRKKPGRNSDETGKYTGRGIFTIVDETVVGTSKWGLLKSYADRRDGWICLDYAENC